MKKTVMGFIAAIVSILTIFPAWAGEWQQDGQGWRYLKDDGEYAVNVLYLIGEDRYGFDENGYMITGWYEGSQGWRYFYDNGICARKAWVEGKYYIDGKGIMMTNAWTPDGYYVGEDGAWIERKKQERRYYGYSLSGGGSSFPWIVVEGNIALVDKYDVGKYWQILYYDENLGAYVTGEPTRRTTFTISEDGLSAKYKRIRGIADRDDRWDCVLLDPNKFDDRQKDRINYYDEVFNELLY